MPSYLELHHHHHHSRDAPDRLLPAVAGVVSEAAHLAVTLPLDLVKVRLQLRPGLWYPEDRAMGRCICQTRRREGLLALWKGLLPSFSLKVSKVAFKFMCFEWWVDLATFGPEPDTASFVLAGMAVGVSEAMLFNSLEVLKVTQQADRRTMRLCPSVWQVLTDLVRKHGFTVGLLRRGLGPTIARDTLFNGVYFGMYYSTKETLAVRGLAESCLLGLVASVSACVASMPLDVVKTRVQAVAPYREYRQSTLAALGHLARREGLRGLYSGLGPKLVKVAPGGTLTFLLYDYTFSRLQEAAAAWRERYRHKPTA